MIVISPIPFKHEKHSQRHAVYRKQAKQTHDNHNSIAITFSHTVHT